MNVSIASPPKMPPIVHIHASAAFFGTVICWTCFISCFLQFVEFHRKPTDPIVTKCHANCLRRAIATTLLGPPVYTAVCEPRCQLASQLLCQFFGQARQGLQRYGSQLLEPSGGGQWPWTGGRRELRNTAESREISRASSSLYPQRIAPAGKAVEPARMRTVPWRP